VRARVKIEVEKFIGGSVGSVNEPPPAVEPEEIEDDQEETNDEE
jgi:hypothetical protein